MPDPRRLGPLHGLAPWLLVGALLGLAPAARAAEPYGPGEVIVKYRPSLKGLQRAGVRAAANATLERRIDLIGAELLRLPDGVGVESAIAELSRDPGVAYAEPNYRLHILAVPNDSLFAQQWGI